MEQDERDELDRGLLEYESHYQTECPKVLKDFLDNLSIEDAREVFGWLNGDPQAIDDMLQIVSEVIYE